MQIYKSYYTFFLFKNKLKKNKEDENVKKKQ